MKKKLLSLLLMLITVSTTVAAQSKEVLLQTTKGDIRIRLYDDTPGHRDNFLQNVREGMYDGVLFHRIIRNFMVQTGNPDTRPGVTEKVEPEDSTQMGPSIPAEIRFPEHYHIKGVVAAAREGDDINPEKASSKYQFYIVTGKFLNEEKMMGIEQSHQNEKIEARYLEKMKANEARFEQLRAERKPAEVARLMEKLHEEAVLDVQEMNEPFFTDEILRAYRTNSGAPWLDGDYTVFGEVVDGMKVVSKIEKVKTDKEDAPLEDVRIIKATVVE